MQTAIYEATVRCVLNGTVQAVCWADERVRTVKHEKTWKLRINISIYKVYIYPFNNFFSGSENNGQGNQLCVHFAWSVLFQS